MTTATSNFLGIPVEGEITRSNRTDQRPITEFSPILAAALAQPEIIGIRWGQYTPYFNDGDTCEFGVHGVEFFLTEETAKAVSTDGKPYAWGSAEIDGVEYWGYENPVCGIARYGIARYNYSSGSYKYEVDEAKYAALTPLQRAIFDLNHAVDGGEFYDVLLENFGDHARVLVTRDKITVETYDHE